jgi:hypothetical protein
MQQFGLDDGADALVGDAGAAQSLRRRAGGILQCENDDIGSSSSVTAGPGCFFSAYTTVGTQGYISVSLQHRIIVLHNDLQFIEHYYHEVTINQGIDILKLESEVDSLKIQLDSLTSNKK